MIVEPTLRCNKEIFESSLRDITYNLTAPKGCFLRASYWLISPAPKVLGDRIYQFLQNNRCFFRFERTPQAVENSKQLAILTEHLEKLPEGAKKVGDIACTLFRVNHDQIDIFIASLPCSLVGDALKILKLIDRNCHSTALGEAIVVLIKETDSPDEIFNVILETAPQDRVSLLLDSALVIKDLPRAMNRGMLLSTLSQIPSDDRLRIFHLALEICQSCSIENQTTCAMYLINLIKEEEQEQAIASASLLKQLDFFCPAYVLPTLLFLAATNPSDYPSTTNELFSILRHLPQTNEYAILLMSFFLTFPQNQLTVETFRECLPILKGMKSVEKISNFIILCILLKDEERSIDTLKHIAAALPSHLSCQWKAILQILPFRKLSSEQIIFLLSNAKVNGDLGSIQLKVMGTASNMRIHALFFLLLSREMLADDLFEEALKSFSLIPTDSL